MDSYRDKLSQQLAAEPSQEGFAKRIGRSQTAVSRYAAGLRFPDAETAKAIDEATGGAVPLSLWQQEAMRRIGIAA
jgi:transcriptional regulator with XRE-family HTH domain